MTRKILLVSGMRRNDGVLAAFGELFPYNSIRLPPPIPPSRNNLHEPRTEVFRVLISERVGGDEDSRFAGKTARGPRHAAYLSAYPVNAAGIVWIS